MSPQPPTNGGFLGERPAGVVIAAVLFLTGAPLGILLGSLVTFGGVLGGGFSILFGVIAIGSSAVQLVTGIKLLSMSSRWRRIGLTVAWVAIAVNLVFILLAVSRGVPGQSIAYLFPLVLTGFVIRALKANELKFSNP